MKKGVYVLLLIIALLGTALVFTQNGDNSEREAIKSEVRDSRHVESQSNKQIKNHIKTDQKKFVESSLSPKEQMKEAELSRTKQILEQVIPDGEATRRVDSAEISFFESSQTVESVQVETEIYNSIYEEGIYDNLKNHDLTFNKVECKKTGCKLEFKLGNNVDENTLSKKRLIIFSELRRLGKLKDKQAVSNTDNNTIHYYYY